MPPCEKIEKRWIWPAFFFLLVAVRVVSVRFSAVTAPGAGPPRQLLRCVVRSQVNRRRPAAGPEHQECGRARPVAGHPLLRPALRRGNPGSLDHCRAGHSPQERGHPDCRGEQPRDQPRDSKLTSALDVFWCLPRDTSYDWDWEMSRERCVLFNRAVVCVVACISEKGSQSH